MISKFRCILFCLLLACFGSAQAANQLSIDAVWGVQNGRNMLIFSVKNTTKSTIGIYNAELPAGTHRSVIISAVEKGNHKALPKLGTIDDAGGLTIIYPGEQQQFAMSLDDIFRGLDDALRRNDVVISWHYKPVDNDNKPLGTYSGHVVLPKLKN